jgi:hypothetical protein
VAVPVKTGQKFRQLTLAADAGLMTGNPEVTGSGLAPENGYGAVHFPTHLTLELWR